MKAHASPYCSICASGAYCDPAIRDYDADAIQIVGSGSVILLIVAIAVMKHFSRK